MRLEFHNFVKGEKPFFTITIWPADRGLPAKGSFLWLPVSESIAKEVGGSGMLLFEVSFVEVEFSFEKLAEGDFPESALEALPQVATIILSPIRGSLKPLLGRKSPPTESTFHHNDPKPAKKGKKS